MAQNLTNWKTWVYGLAAAAISASADAILAYKLLPGIDWHDFGWFVGAKALLAAALYLKKSPLPQ